MSTRAKVYEASGHLGVYVQQAVAALRFAEV